MGKFLRASNHSFLGKFKLFIKTIKGGAGGKGLAMARPIELSGIEFSMRNPS